MLWFQSAADSDWINAAGGRVTRDRVGRVTGVDLRASWVNDADHARLARLPQLAQLDLSLTRITDLGRQQLKTAPAIEELNLHYAEDQLLIPRYSIRESFLTAPAPAPRAACSEWP